MRPCRGRPRFSDARALACAAVVPNSRGRRTGHYGVMDYTGSAPAELLVKPPPQLYAATSQLAAVASALEAGETGGARDALLDLDLEACRRHWVAGGSEASRRHQKRHHIAAATRERGAVSATMRIQIGERDGWRCRYCTLPVVWDGYFRTLFAVKFSDIGDSVNDLWRIFGMSPDHVLPLAVGGDNAPANVVTACGTCNYAKGHCLLDELGLNDPRSRPPIPDAWRGLVGRPHAGTPGVIWT